AEWRWLRRRQGARSIRLLSHRKATLPETGSWCSNTLEAQRYRLGANEKGRAFHIASRTRDSSRKSTGRRDTSNGTTPRATCERKLLRKLLLLHSRKFWLNARRDWILKGIARSILRCRGNTSPSRELEASICRPANTPYARSATTA